MNSKIVEMIRSFRKPCRLSNASCFENLRKSIVHMVRFCISIDVQNCSFNECLALGLHHRKTHKDPRYDKLKDDVKSNCLQSCVTEIMEADQGPY